MQSVHSTNTDVWHKIPMYTDDGIICYLNFCTGLDLINIHHEINNSIERDILPDVQRFSDITKSIDDKFDAKLNICSVCDNIKGSIITTAFQHNDIYRKEVFGLVVSGSMLFKSSKICTVFAQGTLFVLNEGFMEDEITISGFFRVLFLRSRNNRDYPITDDINEADNNANKKSVVPHQPQYNADDFEDMY